MLEDTNAIVNSFSTDGKFNITSDVSFKYVGDFVKYKIIID